MLQKTAAWCPNPDKVFISPSGELVDSTMLPNAEIQQDSATGAAQPPGQPCTHPESQAGGNTFHVAAHPCCAFAVDMVVADSM